ncbi:hypothetical protein ABMZ65_01475 [Morganella morganii]|nr:hypothetical protein [Morganella morganii]HDT0713428.1 hypothetical protein [Morganella morganii subsp. morganii]MBC3968557.1 hypothetical protein [Morganella morganii]HBN5713612.1 hypothetical protein [Morganella morganii]HCT1398289.1 hypothetical protein [Morganella morganii]HEI8950134.1 hypothetical protein [Morganella morganii]
MSQKIIISHNNSDLYKTATYASNYAKELRAEIAPLINRLSVDYPAEAARYNGLINELVLMTGITASGIKNQIQ